MKRNAEKRNCNSWMGEQNATWYSPMRCTPMTQYILDSFKYHKIKVEAKTFNLRFRSSLYAFLTKDTFEWKSEPISCSCYSMSLYMKLVLNPLCPQTVAKRVLFRSCLATTEIRSKFWVHWRTGYVLFRITVIYNIKLLNYLRITITGSR